MAAVLMYSTRWCPFCIRARGLLERKGVEFTDIDVDAEPGRRAEMIARGGGRTVPQIWINDHHVGGCDDLFSLERAGQFDAMLADK